MSRYEFKDDVYFVTHEIYNFLKHGQRNHYKKVNAGNIVERNIFGLFQAIVNFERLFSYKTEHMNAYLSLFQTLMPEIFSLDPKFSDLITSAAGDISDMSPKSFLHMVFSNLKSFFPEVIKERADDLNDTSAFYETTFREHRDKRSKSQVTPVPE